MLVDRDRLRTISITSKDVRVTYLRRALILVVYPCVSGIGGAARAHEVQNVSDPNMASAMDWIIQTQATIDCRLSEACPEHEGRAICRCAHRPSGYRKLGHAKGSSDSMGWNGRADRNLHSRSNSALKIANSVWYRGGPRRNQARGI
jgi:hypothetical protein